MTRIREEEEESDVQYVAVVVGCELAVEDGSFVRLLRVEEGDCR